MVLSRSKLAHLLDKADVCLDHVSDWRTNGSLSVVSSFTRITRMIRRTWCVAAAPPPPPARVVPTTVEQLRKEYGERQNKLWGDLGAKETRELYHKLLPTELLQDTTEHSLEERARIAVSARRAARLYARERAMLPVTLPCQLLDGVRVMLEYGSFQPDGMSEEQIWQKYARKYGIDEPLEPGLCVVDEDFFLNIIKKSCTTNEQIDALVRISSFEDVMTETGIMTALTTGAGVVSEVLKKVPPQL